MKAKIYEFDFDGATDWVIASNKKEAVEFYINHTGCEFLENCKITRLAQNKLDTMYLCDPNETEPDEDDPNYNEEDWSCGMKIIETFAEFAKKYTSPELFCSTEF